MVDAETRIQGLQKEINRQNAVIKELKEALFAARFARLSTGERLEEFAENIIERVDHLAVRLMALEKAKRNETLLNSVETLALRVGALEIEIKALKARP